MTSDTPIHDVARVMQMVIVALTPAIAVYLYFYGWGGVLNLALAVAAGLAFEAIALVLRKRPVAATLKDNSALVTAVLLALCLPPLMPWWIMLMAVAAAILLAKHAYGGLGQNVFNPAMVGYAVVLISFPLDVSTWINTPEAFQLSLAESLGYVFGGGLSQSSNYDAMTGATALSRHYDLAIQSATADTIKNSVSGLFGAVHSEWLNMAFFAGGLLLIIKRIITWHLPVALLAGVAVVDLILGTTYPDLLFHWFGGATMMGAFFIITDPVSAPASVRARLIYGFMIGALIYLIRHYGNYPDSVAFAVLLMNCCVPLIDRIDTVTRQ